MSRNRRILMILSIVIASSIGITSSAFRIGLFGDDLTWLRWPVLSLLLVFIVIVLIFRKRINSWALSE